MSSGGGFPTNVVIDVGHQIHQGMPQVAFLDLKGKELGQQGNETLVQCLGLLQSLLQGTVDAATAAVCCCCCCQVGLSSSSMRMVVLVVVVLWVFLLLLLLLQFFQGGS